MNATKIFAAMLCALMFWASVAFAQRSNPCDPRYHFITPSDCTSLAEQAGKHLVEMRQAIGEESAAIAKARRRFWETYPDKPGAAEARDEFGKRLYGKDFYYLYLAMSEALGDSRPRELKCSAESWTEESRDTRALSLWIGWRRSSAISARSRSPSTA